MRVLVVEDSRTLADALVEGLQDEGMAVDVAYDGLQAARKLDLNSYEVVVLDRDLPGVHGDTICRHDHRAREPGDGPHAHGIRHPRRTGQRPQPRSRRLPLEAIPSPRARAPHPRSRPPPAHRSGQDLPGGRNRARPAPPLRHPRRTTARPLGQGIRGTRGPDARPTRSPQRRKPLRPGLGRVRSTPSATPSTSPSAVCDENSESLRQSRPSPTSATASRNPRQAIRSRSQYPSIGIPRAPRRSRTRYRMSPVWPSE